MLKKMKESRRFTIIALWLIAIFFGLIHAWTGRHSMNPDGISYIDMGDAYFRGDWSTAINAYWSSFYSWLLGLAMFLLKPSPYYEFTMIHIVNFAIYLSALASFHFFLMGMLRFRRDMIVKFSNDGDMVLPEGALIALGYILFIWSSLHMITIEEVTPDMCVSAFVYLISGILLQIRMGAIRWTRFIALGVLLGFGCLSKSPMFILSFIFLISSVFLFDDLRKAIPRVIAAAACCLLIVSPYIVGLSKAQGHITLGDTGKLNYLWFVNPCPRYSEEAAVKHPVKYLLPGSEIFEFARPIPVTYLLHYDPAYWSEGIKVNFNPGRQIFAFGANAKKTFWEFPFEFCAIIYGILLFCFVGYRKRLFIKDMLGYWFVIIPAALALVMYWSVHVESRHIGSFIVLLSMGFFSAVRLRGFQETKKWMVNAVICMILLLSITIGYGVVRPSYFMLRDSMQGKETHIHWKIANSLKEKGFHAGDRICYIGNASLAYWARLARLQIIAESKVEENRLPDLNRLINPDVIGSLARLKVKAIVTQITLGEPPSDPGWKQIGDTDHYIYILIPFYLVE